MGISFIPSPAATINQATASLIEGVDKFINPNKDLQIAMQRATASNPELLQHMADLEANAPGTMSKLGLGNLANVIGAIPQSAAATGEAATRPRAGEQAIAKQSADISTSNLAVQKNELNAELVKKAGAIMAQSPEISFDAALKTLTGETSSERTINQAKAKVAPAEADRALAQVQRARELPKDLSEIDWVTEARDFLNGDLSGAAAAAYFGNQDTRDAFTAALHDLQNQRQLDAQKAMAALRGGSTVSNFRTQKAFQEYQKSGGVGDLQAWESYLFDPKTQDRARELLGGAKPANDQEKQLVAIAKVNKQQVNTDKLREITLANDKVATQLKRIDDAVDDEERKVSLDGLNAVLAQRAELGGINVRAEWVDRPWYNVFKSDGLTFKDVKTGKTVPAEAVNATISDPMGTDIMGAPMSPSAEQAFSLISKQPKQNIMAALNKLKMQDTSPGKKVSSEVEQQLINQGIISKVGASK